MKVHFIVTRAESGGEENEDVTKRLPAKFTDRMRADLVCSAMNRNKPKSHPGYKVVERDVD